MGVAAGDEVDEVLAGVVSAPGRRRDPEQHGHGDEEEAGTELHWVMGVQMNTQIFLQKKTIYIYVCFSHTDGLKFCKNVCPCGPIRQPAYSPKATIHPRDHVPLIQPRFHFPFPTKSSSEAAPHAPNPQPIRPSPWLRRRRRWDKQRGEATTEMASWSAGRQGWRAGRRGWRAGRRGWGPRRRPSRLLRPDTKRRAQHASRPQSPSLR